MVEHKLSREIHFDCKHKSIWCVTKLPPFECAEVTYFWSGERSDSWKIGTRVSEGSIKTWTGGFVGKQARVRRGWCMWRNAHSHPLTGDKGVFPLLLHVCTQSFSLFTWGAVTPSCWVRTKFGCKLPAYSCPLNAPHLNVRDFCCSRQTRHCYLAVSKHKRTSYLYI